MTTALLSDVAAIEDPVALTVALINISSLSGQEIPMADALEAWWDRHGWSMERQEVAPQVEDGDTGNPRFNVLARPKGATSPRKDIRVLFNSHIDTVPPFIPAREDDEYVHGRGACDTKGVQASQLFAANRLLQSGVVGPNDIAFLYVVSEETDHSGMVAANALGLDPEFLICGEPTEMRLIRLQKGMIKINLSCAGVACHSGYPEFGKSAIHPIVQVLADLLQETWPSDPVLGDTTLNIGLINGGQATNALAEKATASLMWRLTVPPEEIEERLRLVIGDRPVESSIVSKNPPTHLGQVDGFESGVVSYNTDIPYFTLQRGTPYLFGPGSITDAHALTEKIRKQDIFEAIEKYVQLVTKLVTK
eukprot:m.180130 g.180130  ORF g.180130 m.180130 type:complete len:364 (-) comp18007_c0_seq2:146-1237(-)